MPEPLDNLARELRSAVQASDHEKATRLIAEYTEALGQHWTALSGNQRAASPLPQQSRELLNWVRKMTLMQQAMAAVKLSAVEKASRQLTARALYLQSAAFDVRG
jgi:hypothetical protein